MTHPVADKIASGIGLSGPVEIVANIKLAAEHIAETIRNLTPAPPASEDAEGEN